MFTAHLGYALLVLTALVVLWRPLLWVVAALFVVWCFLHRVELGYWPLQDKEMDDVEE